MTARVAKHLPADPFSGEVVVEVGGGVVGKRGELPPINIRSKNEEIAVCQKSLEILQTRRRINIRHHPGLVETVFRRLPPDLRRERPLEVVFGVGPIPHIRPGRPIRRAEADQCVEVFRDGGACILTIIDQRVDKFRAELGGVVRGAPRIRAAHPSEHVGRDRVGGGKRRARPDGSLVANRGKRRQRAVINTPRQAGQNLSRPAATHAHQRRLGSPQSHHFLAHPRRRGIKDTRQTLRQPLRIQALQRQFVRQHFLGPHHRPGRLGHFCHARFR